jgi:blue light- and temperature-responsive anti-repressor
MDDTIYQLIYCSRNTIADCHTDVDVEIGCILDASRRNNRRDRVTGALLFSAGSFAQVLEGPLAAIERTFERIQCDPRHGDVVVLQVHRSGRRDFGEWSMAYAGRLEAASEAARALSRACEQQDTEGAETVLATLRHLVGREEEWASTGS